MAFRMKKREGMIRSLDMACANAHVASRFKSRLEDELTKEVFIDEMRTRGGQQIGAGGKSFKSASVDLFIAATGCSDVLAPLCKSGRIENDQIK